MVVIAEAFGMLRAGPAAIPAVHPDRLRAAEATGIAAVQMIGTDRSPDKIITAKSIENALRVLLAIVGSPKVLVRLTALERVRARPMRPPHSEHCSSTTPCAG